MLDWAGVVRFGTSEIGIAGPARSIWMGSRIKRGQHLQKINILEGGRMAAARHGTEGTQLFGTARHGSIWHGTDGMARPGTAKRHFFDHFFFFAALYKKCVSFFVKRSKKEKVVKNWLDRFVAARVCQKKALKNQKLARPFRSCEGLLKKGFKNYFFQKNVKNNLSKKLQNEN